MNKAEKAILEMNSMDDLANAKSPLHTASSMAKLVLTCVYILITVSFHKYDLAGLSVMVLFPIVGYQISGISVRTCFSKLKIVLPLVCAVGVLNPFFDKSIQMRLGTLAVTGGVISMITLMMKGVFCVMASFLLAATTGIDRICYGLRQLHVPKLLVSLFLLTCRYVTVLLEEVAVMTQAYQLRAPGQKGIHFKAWGSFLGQLLLRTMDKGEALYESMQLRGFQGDFYYVEPEKNKPVLTLLAVAAICALMVLCRLVPVATLLGTLVTGGMG